jgi:hypothetical protein
MFNLEVQSSNPKHPYFETKSTILWILPFLFERLDGSTFVHERSEFFICNE